MDWAHYPVTRNNDEWQNELMSLEQLLVEGFEEKWLRRFAAQLGRKLEGIKGSLNLMQECLIGIGIEEDEAESIVYTISYAQGSQKQITRTRVGKRGTHVESQSIPESCRLSGALYKSRR